MHKDTFPTPPIYLLTLCPIVWPFLLIVIPCPVCVLGSVRKYSMQNGKSGIKYPSIYIRGWFTLLVVHQPRYNESFFTWMGTQRVTITHQPTQLLSSSIYLWCCIFYRVHEKRRNLFARKGVGGNCSFDKYKKDNRN